MAEEYEPSTTKINTGYMGQIIEWPEVVTSRI
jgi:hypothetical protein